MGEIGYLYNKLFQNSNLTVSTFRVNLKLFHWLKKIKKENRGVETVILTKNNWTREMWHDCPDS